MKIDIHIQFYMTGIHTMQISRIALMLQDAEIHNRICDSIQKVTTTHAAVRGSSQPHMHE